MDLIKYTIIRPDQIDYRRAENVHKVQNFVFFESRAVNAKIKTGINSHAPACMQSSWYRCGFLASRYSEEDLVPLMDIIVDLKRENKHIMVLLYGLSHFDASNDASLL